METEGLPPYLNVITLGLVVLILLGALFLFLRKRSNRHPMEKSPDGAIATVEVERTATTTPERRP